MIPEAEQDLRDILDSESIETVFQPIVDLLTGATVAYEGLSRGPDGSTLHMPTDLFGAARSADRLEQLDWLCRVATLQAALDADLRPPLTLFLNVEPGVLTPPPDEAGVVLARAMGGLRVMVELTERALLERPATLLRFVEAVRHIGWGIAVDDIGAHPHSLAMLSVIEPDVVKIDQPMLRAMTPAESAALILGIQTYCRRAGARVVAEGLETSLDVDTARSIGSHYGQGWLFGTPVPLAPAPPTAAAPIPMINARPHLPTRRLIHLLTRTEPAQQVDRERIDRVTAYLLEYAAQLGPNTLIVACVQNADWYERAIRKTFEEAAERVAYLGLLGVGMPPAPIHNAQGTALRSADPLASEWALAIIGLQEAIAVVASDLGDEYDAGPARRYEYAVTYDPQTVTDVARALLSRVT